MNNNNSKKSCRILFLILSLVLATNLLFALPAHAAPQTGGTGQTGTTSQTNQPPATTDTTAASLESGGSGLNIAGTGQVKISNAIPQGRTLGQVVTSMVNYFIGLLGFIAVLTFVYAGVLWVVSGGEEAQITKAKKIMTYSALGLLVVILSYTIVTFIVSSAGGGAGVGISCKSDTDCAAGTTCDSAQKICVSTTGGGGTCTVDADCSVGYTCVNKTCVLSTTAGGCSSTTQCQPGQYCSVLGKCVQGTSLNCTDNSQCTAPKQCDSLGNCHDPSAGSGSACKNNSDCPTAYVCNVDKGKCEIQGTGTGQGGVTGGATQAASDEDLNKVDDTINQLGDTLGTIGDDISSLSKDNQDAVSTALQAGTLADKMAGVDALLKGTTDPAVTKVLEKLMAGLEQLLLLRQEMDDLRTVMPESEDTIKAYDDASKALDELIDDPTSSLKLRRFENLYRSLKDLIRKFPIVVSKIKATPGEGNVPFTVTFDGLDSSDPTGGTISNYKWSFLDNTGKQISLGDSPVVTYEFKDPNTYSVRLEVSTSNTDKSGYKTAMDGISTVRIKANPPASHVDFRINGVVVVDVYHVTLAEAKAGISFDPAPTVPAMGRTINKYEWSYGDTNAEERTVPATVVHSYGKPGEYYVTLKVTDSVGQTDTRAVKLDVKSLAANIDFIPAEGNVNTEFRFRGINSRSDGGMISQYQWQITDSSGAPVTSSSEESFYYTFDRPGKYNVELTVTDNSGAQDKTVQTLNVVSRKPIASFDYSIPKPNHPNTVEFDASTSYDPDQGDTITYSWDFNGDGQFEVVDSKDATASYTYNKVGQYKVSLQVTDSFGMRTQIEKSVKVDSVLAGDIVIAKKAVQVGEEVTFKAESQNAVAYLWEFGDGATKSTQDTTVTHKYDKKGKFNVKLNFFDRDDNSNTDASFVLVGEGDKPIAVADALMNGRNQMLVDNLCGQGVSGYQVTRSDDLSFSARNSINLDGSGRMLSYDWKFSNGTHNDKRDFTYRFEDINAPGECSSVSLVVQDTVGGSVSDEDVLYFKVINKLPTLIDFVVESDNGKELITPTKVRLKAVGAKDEDGQIKKYKWWYYRDGFETEQLGVHSTTTSDTEMVITAEGEPGVKNRFYFAVEMTDNDGGVYNSIEQFGPTSYLDVTNGPNVAPVAAFTVDKTTISVGDTITFVSQSYDPQGDTLPSSAFAWDFDGDGSFDDTTSGPQVSRQYNTPGQFEAKLKVTNRGLSSTASKTVFVEPTTGYPQAAFTYTIDGNSVRFDANGSRYDPNLKDTTLRFKWDFDTETDADGNGIKDDDSQSTDVAPTYTYATPKLYHVKLTVLDSLGNQGVVVRDVDLNQSAEQRAENTYHSIKVSAPNQALTTLELSITPYNLNRGDTADIVAVVLNADNSPYNGNVFYEVLEGSGQFTPNPVKAVDGRASAIFTAVDPGAVRIKVTATGTYYGDVSEEVILNVK